MLLELIIKFLSVFFYVIKLIMGEFDILVFVDFLFVEGRVNNGVTLLCFGFDFAGELVFEKLCFIGLVVIIISLEIFSYKNELFSGGFLQPVCFRVYFRE